MKFKYRLIILFLFIQSNLIYSQESEELEWWDPLKNDFNVIEGQIQFKNQELGYHRFPSEIKERVRLPVWHLSNHSAGLSIKFRSNSPNISVKYKLKGDLAMSHMPATGVSGLDLYAKDSDGQWVWVKGNYSFGEHSTYLFKKLNPNDQYHQKGREYKLYLPLYNSIDSLKIGVPEETKFELIPLRKEKPIVVYGTSIAQGACASRPGMAWTAILERRMDRPLINLGFSGNGLLEDEIINIIKDIDAKVYVLDCLPNLVANPNRDTINVKERIISSVRKLRESNSETPILLVEHAGYSDGEIQLTRKKKYVDINKTMKEAFLLLKSEGVKNISLLTKEDINLNMDSTVDGSHPNDLGMQLYADAYEKSLRIIFKEPLGNISTTIPVSQDRDAQVYNWNLRHKNILEKNKKTPPNICFIGNSIVHQWGGTPDATYLSGDASWNKYLKKIGVQNFGFGWDRIENVLWRVYHDELDAFESGQILMKIGTNNLHLNSNEEIIEGIYFLVNAIKKRQAKAKITLVGILPRRDNESRINELNTLIKTLSKSLHINYLEIGKVLLNKDDKIDESLFRDGLHPNAKGYKKLGPLIQTYLLEQ